MYFGSIIMHAGVMRESRYDELRPLYYPSLESRRGKAPDDGKPLALSTIRRMYPSRSKTIVSGARNGG